MNRIIGAHSAEQVRHMTNETKMDLITILRFSFNHNDTITSAIALRFENLKLLKDVQEANDNLHQEITERRKAEEALRSSKTELEEINQQLRGPCAIHR